LLRGRGKFTDDIKLREMLYLNFVRSPYAHAKILSIDVSAAETQPGVICTLTGAEIAPQTQPFIEIGPEPFARIKDYPMGVTKVRYQGEPVAAVVAESAALAEDAAELVHVEYEALDPVVDGEEALKNNSILHDEAGTNRVWNGVFEYGDVEKAFKEAAHIVSIDRLHFHRFSSTPLENNVIIAEWDPKDERIYYSCNNSFPSFAIQFLATHLNVHIDRIRVETFDIGGSFGIKITSYPQMAVCALASKKAGGRPVKWVETRSEHIISSAHGNERSFHDTKAALDKNGVITAVVSRHIDDCGAYPRYEPLGCVIWAQVFPGVYRFKNARIDFSQAVTNKCPVGPNRGYSRMQHLWFLERVIDICAHELGIPPDEMRLRNYIRPDEFPYTTPNGCVYDSGNYPKMLEVAKQQIGWDEWKKKQAAARKEGRRIGIGIGTTLDSGTNNFGQSQIVNPGLPYSGNSQGANCKLDIYGEVVVAVGSCPQGQGHETTAAQVVADVLKIHPDMVTVRTGFDTERNVHTGFSGTYASQFAVSGLSAVHGAAQKLKAEMKRLGAFVLETAEDDLELGVGAQGPELRARSTGKAINYWGMANLVLRTIGLGRYAEAWLANPATALPALILVTTWMFTGFHMVILLTALHTIPQEYLEAATVDGAGRWQRTFRIVIPLLRPTLVNLIILDFIGKMKQFALVWVMTRGGPMRGTETVATYVIKRAFEWKTLDLGYPSAIAVIWFIIIFGLSFVLMRFLQRREALEF
jgi:2-furoyl-CoA dehydrogenase large subunit